MHCLNRLLNSNKTWRRKRFSSQDIFRKRRWHMGWGWGGESFKWIRNPPYHRLEDFNWCIWRGRKWAVKYPSNYYVKDALIRLMKNFFSFFFLSCYRTRNLRNSIWSGKVRKAFRFPPPPPNFKMSCCLYPPATLYNLSSPAWASPLCWTFYCKNTQRSQSACKLPDCGSGKAKASVYDSERMLRRLLFFFYICFFSIPFPNDQFLLRLTPPSEGQTSNLKWDAPMTFDTSIRDGRRDQMSHHWIVAPNERWESFAGRGTVLIMPLRLPLFSWNIYLVIILQRMDRGILFTCSHHSRTKGHPQYLKQQIAWCLGLRFPGWCSCFFVFVVKGDLAHLFKPSASSVLSPQ